MVLSDDSHGADLAALRLIEAKCKKVAVVTSGSQTPAQLRRAKAFTQRMQAEGVDVVAWSGVRRLTSPGCRRGVELLVDKAIDGAFCVTDLLALGFLDAARLEMNRRVPQDVSIVGFDDIPQAGWKGYGLTTVAPILSGPDGKVLSALDSDEPGNADADRAGSPGGAADRRAKAC